MKANINLTDEQVRMLEGVIKDDNCRMVLLNYGKYMLHRGMMTSIVATLCGYLAAELTSIVLKLAESKKSSK